jgi:DNA-binding MarR family transcriptional regulator
MPERSDEPLRGDDLDTWASLATVLVWLPEALDAQLMRDSGLTHFEYGVLYALANAPEGALRMSVLAGYANSTLSRLSRAVTRLETRGWVERRPDPGDGRSTLAGLTPMGRERVQAATPGHEATVRRLVLDPLTRVQRRNLRDASRRIVDAFGSDGEWAGPAAGGGGVGSKP